MSQWVSWDYKKVGNVINYAACSHCCGQGEVNYFCNKFPRNCPSFNVGLDHVCTQHNRGYSFEHMHY